MPYLKKTTEHVYYLSYWSMFLTILVSYLIAKFITQEDWDTDEHDSLWKFLVIMSKSTAVIFFIIKILWRKIDLDLTFFAQNIIYSVRNLLVFVMDPDSWEPVHSKFTEWIRMDHLGHGDVEKIEIRIKHFQEYHIDVYEEVLFYHCTMHALEITKQFIIIWVSLYVLICAHAHHIKRFLSVIIRLDLEYYTPSNIKKNVTNWFDYKKNFFNREKGLYKKQWQYCIPKLDRWYLFFRYILFPQILATLFFFISSWAFIDYWFVSTVLEGFTNKTLKIGFMIPEMPIHFVNHARALRGLENHVWWLYSNARFIFIISTTFLLFVYYESRKQFRFLIYSFMDVVFNLVVLYLMIIFLGTYHREYWEPLMTVSLDVLESFWYYLSNKNNWNFVFKSLDTLLAWGILDTNNHQYFINSLTNFIEYAKLKHHWIVVFKKFSFGKQITTYLYQATVFLPIFLYFIFDLVKNDFFKKKKFVQFSHDKNGDFEIIRRSDLEIPEEPKGDVEEMYVRW
jgi:hypothetical protein